MKPIRRRSRTKMLHMQRMLEHAQSQLTATTEKGRVKMHGVIITMIINTHEDIPSQFAQQLAAQGQMPPVIAQKELKFMGKGWNIRDAVAQAMSRLADFVDSDGVEAGSLKVGDSEKLISVEARRRQRDEEEGMKEEEEDTDED